jgi:transposase
MRSFRSHETEQLHLVVDNYATHKHPAVQRWAARHRRFHFHFAPTRGSWLHMVERFFRDLTENQLRRGVFTSVQALQARIFAYIEEHNRQPKPMIWTAKANETLEKVKRAKANLNNSSPV